MEGKLKQLKSQLSEITDLGLVNSLLNWDQSTYMPPGGAKARGRQSALLARIAHEKLIDPGLGQLLGELSLHTKELAYESDEASLVRIATRDHQQAAKVPSSLMEAFYKHTAESYEAWTIARPANDFNTMKPYLEKTLEFSRQYADCFPGYDHIADPLINRSDEGVKANDVKTTFAALREQLVPLVKAISEKQQVDDSFLHLDYPEQQQMQFGLDVINDYGYDFQRGRQDKTHHPFCTKFSLGDVRITTRFQENYLGEGMFSTMHEAGHALYEQNVDMNFEGTPLASGTSSSVHESQSRLWENLVGRSRSFWHRYFGGLQKTFPEQLGNVDVETFYKAINKVNPSLIRTDADEVTYNLHVMIRFDLELDMLEGKLKIDDLPDAWNARYQSDLGVVAPSNVNGVLQDVHWFAFFIGGVFQGYTLGNVISVQLFDTALEQKPQIADEIGQGKFDTLRHWMRDNVNQHGRKFTTNELLESATGKPLTIDPYINYLKKKYGDIYQL